MPAKAYEAMGLLVVEDGQQVTGANESLHAHNVRHAQSHRARVRSLKLQEEYNLPEVPSTSELLIYERMVEGLTASPNTTLTTKARNYNPNYARLLCE